MYHLSQTKAGNYRESACMWNMCHSHGLCSVKSAIWVQTLFFSIRKEILTLPYLAFSGNTWFFAAASTAPIVFMTLIHEISEAPKNRSSPIYFLEHHCSSTHISLRSFYFSTAFRLNLHSWTIF